MPRHWILTVCSCVVLVFAAAGCSDGGDGCPAGQTPCDGVCTDVMTDEANCGACSTVCEAGSVCNGGGQCALSCQQGLTDCNGTCVDTAADNRHCGACGSVCDPGEVCAGAGTCALSCQAGLIDCNGTCIDPMTDDAFCGASGDCVGFNDGNVCEDGFKCDGAGQCALSCQAGLLECNGTCIDPLSDNTFCGASADCTGANAGAICSDGFKCNGAGTCELTCQPGLVECSGTCIDPLSNPMFCGASDPCATDPGVQCAAAEACVGGTCAAVENACGPLAGFAGTPGPQFIDACWRQCAGYLDVDDGTAGDQVPLAWGQPCDGVTFNVLRVVCGSADGSQYRYIDINKNIFRDGLVSFPETGLILDARDQTGTVFAIQANEIWANGNDPNTGTSWYAGSNGFCTQANNIMTVNNTAGNCREVDDCFGIATGLIGQDVFLGVYVLE